MTTSTTYVVEVEPPGDDGTRRTPRRQKKKMYGIQLRFHWLARAEVKSSREAVTNGNSGVE